MVFQCSEGYLNCPKCGGWQVLDKTRRRATGWPIGNFDYINCDNCNGKGEVPDNAYNKPSIGWTIPPIPEVVSIDSEVVMPGWDNYVK